MDIAATNQLGQLVQVGTGQQSAAGVVRGVEEDQPGARRDCISQTLPIDSKVQQCQRHMHATPTGQLHRGLVTVVARVEHDGFIPRMNQRLHRAKDRLGGAGGDGDLAVGITLHAVAAGDLRRHLLAQTGQPGHWRILVAPFHDMARDGFAQCLRPVEIREALGQIDRASLQSELGHPREDGGADVGQFADEHRDFLRRTRQAARIAEGRHRRHPQHL